MRDTKHRSWRRALALVTLAVAVTVGTASAAFAAPAEPTMSTGDLQAFIDSNGGSVTGYFKTVLKDDDIVEIPVEIKAVTGGFADGPPELAALILFEASGPEIDEIGGVAAGMSGSPLFVDEGVVNDVLVGAVSYGDWFTLNGAGLATPVGAMAAIENDYPVTITGFKTLPAPVAIGERLVTDVVVTSKPEAFADDSERGTLVAKPLATRYVGGLSPNTPVYQAYRRHLAAKGETLVPMAHGLSSMEHPYNAPFEGGSAIAALAARGDLWAGGIGTVTYVNGNKVLAFGHPAFHEGDTGLLMTNAWIDGVWPSSDTPYKLGRPAATRGTITQDRGAGIMGVDGLDSSVATITATVVNLDTSKVGTSTVTVPSHVMNSMNWDYDGLAPMSTYVAAMRACDVYWTKGSASTTTTVVVSDGADEHTIVRTNVFDDDYDIQSAAMWDVAEIVAQLQYLGENGIDEPNIVSVDLQASITKDRRFAQIVDVNVVGGVRTGTNTAVVSLLQWGVEDTQTVNVPFTIPSGVPLTGVLIATGSEGYDADDGPDYDEEGFSADTLFGIKPSTQARRSVARAAADLEAAPSNDSLQIVYQPYDMISEFDEEFVAPRSYRPIEVSDEIGWVVQEGIIKSAPKFRFSPAMSRIGYYDSAELEGELLNATNDGRATVSMRLSGFSSPISLGGLNIEADDTFEFYTPPLSRNARLTFTYPGDADTLPTVGTIGFGVRAYSRLSASRYRIKKGRTTTLTARVSPSTATGRVIFERYSRGRWRSIGSRTLVGGKATLKYKPKSVGTYKMRFRYIPNGTSTNFASNSSSRTIRVVR